MKRGTRLVGGADAGKAFTLRVVVHDKGGKEQFRAEASTVARKNLDDVLFQLPTGFKKAELDIKAASLP